MELNEADFIQIEAGIKMREKKFEKRLYHYTSLNTFLCMVRTREIWMSSTGSMNDRKETTYFIELLEKVFNCTSLTVLVFKLGKNSFRATFPVYNLLGNAF